MPVPFGYENATREFHELVREARDLAGAPRPRTGPHPTAAPGQGNRRSGTAPRPGKPSRCRSRFQTSLTGSGS